MWQRIWHSSIKNRLTFLFFTITAGAIMVLYFYVVPQLESKLTSAEDRRPRARLGHLLAAVRGRDRA